MFPDEYLTLFALAFFEISEAIPLYLFPYWAETTFLDHVSPLSSQELTTLTQQIGRMESERDTFFRRWVNQSGQVHAVVFDITSLSSYSVLLNEVEWGYNRDHEYLPQIHLGVIYADTTNMPLYYQVYQSRAYTDHSQPQNSFPAYCEHGRHHYAYESQWIGA